MAIVGVPSPSNADISWVKLARELAMEILPTETVLKQYGISAEFYQELRQNKLFQRLLQQERETWHSATNTQERVKAKAAAMLEEWLPELNNRLHDMEENLPAKIEGGKLLQRLSGLGMPKEVEGSIGERFRVTINIGAGTDPITIDKPMPVIEGEVVDT